MTASIKLPISKPKGLFSSLSQAAVRSKQPDTHHQSLTSHDILDGGLDIHLYQYFSHGWCNADGSPKESLLSAEAAAVALSLTRLDIVPHYLEALLTHLDASSDCFYLPQLSWTERLPDELRAQLLTFAGQLPEAARKWFRVTCHSIHTWQDLRAYVQHLDSVSAFLHTEGSLRAQSTTMRRGGPPPRTLDMDARYYNLLYEDEGYRAYFEELDELMAIPPEGLVFSEEFEGAEDELSSHA